MLYYCPLESYEERYTMQWAAPKSGWLERNWIKAEIPYKRIDSFANVQREIKTGLVLDIEKRVSHCFSQIESLVTLALTGKLTSDDVIYFDDFWHPGIEALPYAFHQIGIAPKMYAFCHAQSVDKYDFTHSMRHWMRDFEIGIGKILTGIFVNSNLLKQLLDEAGISTYEKIHVIGHIFCEEEVRERFPKLQNGRQRKFQRENNVIFSSRWDDEKNPLFFLEVVKKVMNLRQDIKFIVCTSSKKLKSNNKNNLEALRKTLLAYPNNLFLKEGLSKEEYYTELLKAKIQINTASQDWVSIALLETSTAGCYPLYPNYRSFPQAFRGRTEFLYTPFCVADAANKLSNLMNYPYLWNEVQIQSRAWIHQCHNSSWARMINIMMGKDMIKVEPYE